MLTSDTMLMISDQQLEARSKDTFSKMHLRYIFPDRAQKIRFSVPWVLSRNGNGNSNVGTAQPEVLPTVVLLFFSEFSRWSDQVSNSSLG